MEFHKYPSVESFSHFVKNARRYGMTERNFIAKIKLHGTNAAIVRDEGGLYAQSRSRIIKVGDDNFGFAGFVDTLNPSDFPMNCAVYGEWAGPGVQKSDAVSNIAKKMFFVFAIQDLSTGEVCSDPEVISEMVPNVDGIEVLPIMKEFELNLFDDKDVGAKAQELSDLAESIGKEDPYIKAMWDISGPGEGFVLSPRRASREDYSKMICKVKCEAHRVKKTKAAATAKVEIPANVLAFCDAFITDARIQQAASEACDGEFDFKRIGDFARWFGNDVKKESADELAGMGLEWKDVAKSLNAKAINAYKAKCI